MAKLLHAARKHLSTVCSHLSEAFAAYMGGCGSAAGLQKACKKLAGGLNSVQVLQQLQQRVTQPLTRGLQESCRLGWTHAGHAVTGGSDAGNYRLGWPLASMR